MSFTKALLAGFVYVSLCMANISGIITDTGSTPVAGAVVHLEKGGATATTGADGRFTLTADAFVHPRTDKLYPDHMSARISGNVMTISLTERAGVEVSIYDLKGKLLFTISKDLVSGSHSLSLPYHESGIYLYRVKSENLEIVLKGNTIGGVVSHNMSQGLSFMPLAKQVLAMGLINDVIVVKKTGYLNYRCIQYNSDTSGVAIKMIASAGDMTDADGNLYQTVRIGNQVWTVENLRTTKYNDGSAIPLDTSTITWQGATSPKFCFYKNTTNPDSIKMYGALYNGYVLSAANPKKIAPAGWHVPTDAEWDTLLNYLIAKGYNWDATTKEDKCAKSLSAMADWSTSIPNGTIGRDLTKNNRSGFSALPAGWRSNYGVFNFQSKYCYWWSATEYNETLTWYRSLADVLSYLFRDGMYKSCGLSVRLLKD
jgi:uncharacterized protein (TIGR02145 family)